MNAKHAEWFKSRQWWSDISAMRADSPFWWHGRSIQEMRALSKKAAAERQARLESEIRRFDALFEETARLNQLRFGKPGADKPRLAAYRARAQAVFKTAAKPPVLKVVKSATPNLDAVRVKENVLIRQGVLERIAEFDHHGQLIGHRVKRAGDVKSYGTFTPTPEHARRTRLRLLVSESARRDDAKRGGGIGVDIRWSPHSV